MSTSEANGCARKALKTIAGCSQVWQNTSCSIRSHCSLHAHKQTLRLLPAPALGSPTWRHSSSHWRLLASASSSSKSAWLACDKST